MSFYLKECGETGCDCTTPFEVIFDKEYTVKEFFEEVDNANSDGNWGKIRVSSDPCEQNGELVYYYGRDRGIAMNCAYDNYKIICARCRGGWSNYNYYLQIENKEDKDKKQMLTRTEAKALSNQYHQLMEKISSILENINVAIKEAASKGADTITYCIDKRSLFTQEVDFLIKEIKYYGYDVKLDEEEFHYFIKIIWN